MIITWGVFGVITTIGGNTPYILQSAQVSTVHYFEHLWTHLFTFRPDTDTVELLKRAMRAFRGGFAVVSHNEKLIEEATGVAKLLGGFKY